MVSKQYSVTRPPSFTARFILCGCMVILMVQSLPLASAGTLDRSRRQTPTVVWEACSNPRLNQSGAQCTYLEVPLDYSNPDGEKIEIALSRIKSTASENDYQGIMLVNPGGPGGSGLRLALLVNSVPGTAGQTYDWIGFDPRGVGASKPALSCDPNYLAGPRPDYVPRSFAKEQFWLNRSRNYARACARNNGKILRHITTLDTIRDMEQIRIALGQEKINFYGFSYGTYLGQVYATRYPNRVRRMVLDSNVDPRKIWFEANIDQDIAFDRNFKIWFEWLAQYNDTFKLGGTPCQVEETWNAVMKDLKKNPINNTVGPSEWLDTFLLIGYAQSLWISFAEVFSSWVNERDGNSVISLYEGVNTLGDDNGYAVYLAVQSTDTQWPKDWNTVQSRNWFTYAKAPTITWSNAWFNGPAQYWPAPASQPVPVNGNDAGEILLICETLDAATPFEGSLEVHRRFPQSRLIAVKGGTTHAGSLSGNQCVDDAVEKYLATGELPLRRSADRADLSCEAPPQPNPSARKMSTATEDIRQLQYIQRFRS